MSVVSHRARREKSGAGRAEGVDHRGTASKEAPCVRVGKKGKHMRSDSKQSAEIRSKLAADA